MSRTLLTLWTTVNGDPPARRLVRAAVRFSANRVSPIEMNASPVTGESLMISPVARKGDVLGIVLVPDDLGGIATRNRLFIDGGLHVLRHADCLELGRNRLWVAVAEKGDETVYNPAVHGDDRFCPRTKARLVPNELVVVCPGTPQDECGALYKAAAWKINTPCHQCGFDPGASPWEPPVSRPRNSLHELLQHAYR